MAASLLSLPVEIRLQVYDHLFTPKRVVVNAGTQDEHPTLCPAKPSSQPQTSCSAQLLRVCKQVNREAESYLYARTHLIVLTQAFAGKLPFGFSKEAAHAPKVKSITWQLNCDMMKYFYEEDLSMSPHDLMHLDFLELRCQADNWRGSVCGEWADREAFTRGRNQVVQYAQKLQGLMNTGRLDKAALVENITGWDRGRVILRLSRRKPVLANDVGCSC